MTAMKNIIDETLGTIGMADSFPYDQGMQVITMQRRKLLSEQEIAELPERLLPNRWKGHGVLED